jgi:GTP cyclohydrolase I
MKSAKLQKPEQVVKMPARADARRSIAPEIQRIIQALGEDTTRQGLVDTPERVSRSLQFLTSGYSTDIDKLVNKAMYTVDHDELVVVRDIEFFSMCEHHMLPFFGKMHVGYIADGKVIGLSKIPRIVDAFARRLQIQERLTQQVAGCLMDRLAPLGVGVVCEAQHFCMMMRGVEKQHSGTVTSAMLGVFRDQKQTRDEFLSLIKSR